MNLKRVISISAAMAIGAFIALTVSSTLRSADGKLESGAKFYGRIHGTSFGVTVDMARAVPWNGSDPLPITSDAAAAIAKQAAVAAVANNLTSWLESVNLRHVEGRYFYVVYFEPVAPPTRADPLDSYPVVVYFNGTAQPSLPIGRVREWRP
jgi:hypothetical protein